MKGIKFLSLSQYKHKLFWHLINRQRGIVFRARQVCLVHYWWLLLFCWGSVFAFLSYIVTHLSRERRAAWKMANSNYTHASHPCLVFCSSFASSQTVSSHPYGTSSRAQWSHVHSLSSMLISCLSGEEEVWRSRGHQLLIGTVQLKALILVQAMTLFAPE